MNYKGNRLNGKTAVIVGGAGGIGSVIAHECAAQGARVAVIDIDAERISRFASEGYFGADPLSVVADITQSEQMQRAAKDVAAKFTHIDILVNSAGVSGRPLGDGPVDVCVEEAWHRVLAVNLTGVYLTCKYFIPLFSPTGGSVIHIASDDALIGPRPPHDTHAYCASKGGILALTRAMAVSYAPRHIRVNAICPGWVVTPMTQDLVNDSATWNEIVERHPLGRAGIPEDVAAATVYLAAEESSFVTGVILPVEGGATAW